MCVCVGACGSAYWCAGTLHVSFLVFLPCLLLLLPYHVYHPVPQALTTWWQLRYNISRTACGPLLTMRALTSVCVCAVCSCAHDTSVCMIGVRGSVRLCAGTPHGIVILLYCRIMSVSHRASISQALYFVAASVQQQWTASLCGPFLTM